MFNVSAMCYIQLLALIDAAAPNIELLFPGTDFQFTMLEAAVQQTFERKHIYIASAI